MIYEDDFIIIYLTSAKNNNADGSQMIGSLRSNSSIDIGDDEEHIGSISLSDITNYGICHIPNLSSTYKISYGYGLI